MLPGMFNTNKESGQDESEVRKMDEKLEKAINILCDQIIEAGENDWIVPPERIEALASLVKARAQLELAKRTFTSGGVS